jgi:hypothetical protein
MADFFTNMSLDLQGGSICGEIVAATTGRGWFLSPASGGLGWGPANRQWQSQAYSFDVCGFVRVLCSAPSAHESRLLLLLLVLLPLSMLHHRY